MAGDPSEGHPCLLCRPALPQGRTQWNVDSAVTVQFCNLGLASYKIGSPNTRAGLGRAGAPLSYILRTVLNALREIFPRKLERAGKSGALT